MAEMDLFLNNCGLRKAIGKFSQHNIKMHQITNLSERELEVLFPIIGERQTFKAAMKRKRTDDNCKKRKRAMCGWNVEDFDNRKVLKRTTGLKKVVVKKGKRDTTLTTDHSRIVLNILKNDKAATSELIEFVENLLASHSDSLKRENRRDLPGRHLIDFNIGKINCPACSSQITPLIRKLSPISWKVDNFKRHLENFHADLKDSSGGEDISAMVEVVMQAEDSSDDGERSDRDSQPMKTSALKTNEQQILSDALLSNERLTDSLSIQTIPEVPHADETNEMNHEELAEQLLPTETLPVLPFKTNDMPDEPSVQHSLPIQRLLDVRLSYESLEPLVEKALPIQTAPVQTFPDVPLPKESLTKPLCGTLPHDTNEMLLPSENLTEPLLTQTLLDMPLSNETSTMTEEPSADAFLPIEMLPHESLESISQEQLPILPIPVQTFPDVPSPIQVLSVQTSPNEHLFEGPTQTLPHLPLPNDTNTITESAHEFMPIETLVDVQLSHESLDPLYKEQLSIQTLSDQTFPDVSLPIQTLPTERFPAPLFEALPYATVTDQMILNESSTNQPLLNVDYESEDDVVLCICGLFRDEQVIIQCSKCLVWQHTECTGADVNVDNYLCTRCDNRAVDLEIPLNEFTDDGHQCYLTLLRGDMQVRISDTVYILRDIAVSDSETESTPMPRKHTYKTIGEIDYTELDIFRVEQLWKDGEGNRFVFGQHYLRPRETYHKASKKFYQNEVVQVPSYEKLPIDLIMGRCWILDPITFCKGRPIHCDESHVYICELKVNKTRRSFSKILKQKYTVCTKSYAFINFEQKLVISRNYTPYHVDNAKTKN